MRQTLHIFRKDVRRAWLPIALTSALTVLVAYRLATEPVSFDRWVSGSRNPFAFFLFVGWYYFIAHAILEDRLVGDRQFWLTRPYSQKSLLAAKCLLVAVFINLPVLLGDIAIVAAQGLSPAAAWSHILWRQAALTGIFLLPAAALAVVSSNLAQFALAAVSLAVFVAILPTNRSPVAPWTRLSFAAAVLGSVAVVVWQYARRGTWASRGVLVGTMALLAVLLHVSPRQGGLSPREGPTGSLPAIRVIFTPGERWAITASHLMLPVETVGLPQNWEAEVDDVLLRADTQPGRSYLQDVYFGASLGRPSRLSFWLPSEILHAPGADLHLSIDLTIYGPPNRVNLVPNNGPYPIPGLGNCYTSSNLLHWPFSLVCHSTSRAAAGLFTVDGRRLGEQVFFGGRQESPVFTSSPVNISEAGFTVVSRQELAHIGRTLDTRNVRLADYIADKP
jgi:hypothetical protein